MSLSQFIVPMTSGRVTPAGRLLKIDPLKLFVYPFIRPLFLHHLSFCSIPTTIASTHLSRFYEGFLCLLTQSFLSVLGNATSLEAPSFSRRPCSSNLISSGCVIQIKFAIFGVVLYCRYYFRNYQLNFLLA